MLCDLLPAPLLPQIAMAEETAVPSLMVDDDVSFSAGGCDSSVLQLIKVRCCCCARAAAG